MVTETRAVIAPPRQRITSLDGLRGLAALMVLAHHLALSYPPLAQAAELANSGEASPLVAVFAYTPLHVLWAGTEAVSIFFILSGLVLTLPWVSGRRGGWGAYYAARLPRLYIPAWASLVPAVPLVVLIPRFAGTGSFFLDGQASINPWQALRDALLLGGVSPINGPLWSLYYEVLFSLALPAYVIFARRLTNKIVALAASGAMLALVAAGIILEIGALEQLPVFALGAIIAVHLDDLRQLAERITARASWVWAALALAAVLLITVEWMVRGLPNPPIVLVGLGRLCSVVGALIAVLLAIYWARFAAFLDSRPMRWVGVRSFSLYLTHAPIVVGLAFLLGPGNLWLTALISIPLSLLWAAVFYRIVERPSHRLSQRISRSITARQRRKTVPE